MIRFENKIPREPIGKNIFLVGPIEKKYFFYKRSVQEKDWKALL